MTIVSEVTTEQFILPNEEDFIFDNTPLSQEDEERIAAMIQKLKAESKDTQPLKMRKKTVEEERLLQAFHQKSEALRLRRRERYAAQKAQKAVYTEGACISNVGC